MSVYVSRGIGLGFLVAAAVGLAPTAAGEGDVPQLHVPADYPNIKAAIAAATYAPTEIILADGVYVGPNNRDIDLQGKPITLRSEHGAATCVIDAFLIGRIMVCQTVETPATVVKGITFRRGAAETDWGGNGGGVVINHASPTFVECVFDSCYSSSGAGAVYVQSVSAPTFQSCVFTGNKGNIAHISAYTASANVLDCVFDKGVVTSGAALSISTGGTLLAERCRVTNTSLTATSGVPVSVYNAKLTLRDCLIAGNVGYSTGAIDVAATVTNQVKIERCTIVGNSCSLTASDSDFCGGIRLNNSAGVVVTDSILWGNLSKNSAAQDSQIRALTNSTVTVTRCCIQGLSGTLPGSGCIGIDPLFTDPDGPDNVPGTADDDYRPSAASPCVDMGDPALNDPSAKDVSGSPRIVGCRVDIGALEGATPRDCNGNGIPDACEIQNGAPDCNGNGILDECEPSCPGVGVCSWTPATYSVSSPQMTGISSGTVKSFSFALLPYAVGPVKMTVTAKATLSNFNQYITVAMNGTPYGTLWVYGGGSCPATPDVDFIWLSASSFNAMRAAGPVKVDLIASSAVGSGCTGSFLQVALSYPSLPLAVDCNRDGIPDACQPDCNGDGIPDVCQLSPFTDCDGDGILDACAIALGIAIDANHDGIPDLCQTDCNGNGIPDWLDIVSGLATDCDHNGILDICEVTPDHDCDGDHIDDLCAIAHGLVPDCNNNGIPDSCDIANGEPDLNHNGIPDSCEPDCDGDGIPDFVEIALGLVADANHNGIPDPCEPPFAPTSDLNGDGVVNGADLGILIASFGPCIPGLPCPADQDGNGIVDGADLAILLAHWG